MADPTGFRFDLAEKFPHLPAAPIVEAVIHWAARPSPPFVPDDFRKPLQARLGSDYPKIHATNLLELKAQVAADGTSTQQRSRWRGFRLESADGRYIAQFNQDGMVFSRLQPYENWERFTAEGKRLWQTFCELGAITEIQRLGVRFINRIPISQIADAARVLQKPPQCLESLGLPLSGFLVTIKHDVPQHPFQVEIVETVQPASPPEVGGYGLILDIDVFTTQGFECNNDVLDDHLTKMRWLKDKAFFALLTRDAITTFEGAKP
jgi:uncharacterized protein (TIGR04255 family)